MMKPLKHHRITIDFEYIILILYAFYFVDVIIERVKIRLPTEFYDLQTSYGAPRLSG